MNRLVVTVWDGAVVVGPPGPVENLVRNGLPDTPPVTLAVSGGQLVWPWSLDGAGDLDPDATLTQPPVAVLDDVTSAQDWLWALYGHDAALAVDAARTQTSVVCAPGLRWLPESAARCAFGTWLAAWWPASTTDGIPALDPPTLRAELEPLGARLDLLFDETGPPLPSAAAGRQPTHDRYALAAGPADSGPSAAVGVSVSTGAGGTVWSDLPAGWVDASDLAVSWRLLHDLDHWSLQVRVAAGPVVVTDQARLVAEAPGRRVELRPGSDSFGRCWLGEATGTEPGPAPERVRVYLPGFAPENPSGSERWHESVRALARARLAAAGTPSGSGPAVTSPWQAERAASSGHDDY